MLGFVTVTRSTNPQNRTISALSLPQCYRASTSADWQVAERGAGASLALQGPLLAILRSAINDVAIYLINGSIVVLALLFYFEPVTPSQINSTRILRENESWCTGKMNRATGAAQTAFSYLRD